MHIGYCGNVHPGVTIDEVKSNLVRHTLEVKPRFRPNSPLEVGLWLSATAARELDDSKTLLEFRDWLAEHQLVPFTLNGFPFGDFHQPVVKHQVYQPDWTRPDRLDYTIRLANILSVISPPGATRTISTLPLGWPSKGDGHKPANAGFMDASARNLKKCAQHLGDLAQATGEEFIVCLEPEPGCILDTWSDVAQFFESFLLNESGSSGDLIRQTLGVCHDVCHSAVMFETQSSAIQGYADSGIQVGKIQVSSAIEVDFDQPDCDAAAMLSTLAQFVEPRYLHQTTVRVDNSSAFYEDLPIAINAAGATPRGVWRVHFHVPVFSNDLGPIATTQSDIQRCLRSVIASGGPIPQFEVETYAWNVLPPELRKSSLADGIAQELAWFESTLEKIRAEA